MFRCDVNKRFVSESGSGTRTTYSSRVRSDGRIELIDSGKEDFHAFIQSFKDQTDISVIMARLAAGDLTPLSAAEGMYGDFTNMPSTLAEAMQLRIDSERLFYSLPADVRKQFDMDPDKFFASSGSKEWAEKLGDSITDDAKKVFGIYNELSLEFENNVNESEVVDE